VGVREDHKLGLVTCGGCKNIVSVRVCLNATHQLAGTDEAFDALQQASYDPAVTFGPDERAFFFKLAGAKQWMPAQAEVSAAVAP
jgi:hypothetical protein